MSLTVESKPSAETINSRIHDFIVSLQEVMPTETCRFTPSLIDTMHRVVAIDGLFLIINLQIAFTLITIMIENNMYRTILLWRDAEDGRMTASRHFHLQMFLIQKGGIIMGMRDFICVRERRRSFLRSQTQLAC